MTPDNLRSYFTENLIHFIRILLCELLQDTAGVDEHVVAWCYIHKSGTCVDPVAIEINGSLAVAHIYYFTRKSYTHIQSLLCVIGVRI